MMMELMGRQQQPAQPDATDTAELLQRLHLAHSERAAAAETAEVAERKERATRQEREVRNELRNNQHSLAPGKYCTPADPPAYDRSAAAGSGVGSPHRSLRQAARPAAGGPEGGVGLRRSGHPRRARLR